MRIISLHFSNKLEALCLLNDDQVEEALARINAVLEHQRDFGFWELKVHVPDTLSETLEFLKSER